MEAGVKDQTRTDNREEECDDPERSKKDRKKSRARRGKILPWAKHMAEKSATSLRKENIDGRRVSQVI